LKKSNRNKPLSRVKKRGNKKRWIKRVLLLTLFIGVLFVSFTGYASWKLNNVLNKASEKIEINQSANSEVKKKSTDKEEPVVEKKFEDEPFAMLLLGEDYRPETGSKNTDVIIVSVWNPDTKEINLLSIPRDTRVNIPDHGYAKINSAYVKGELDKKAQERNGKEPTTSGAHLVMETLSDYLDIPITRYMKVDFKGFEAVIDELGGIQIDVERNMYYQSSADNTYINLKKGLQELDGKQALGYARFRKSSNGNDSNDFERNARHQKIIRALTDKLKSFKGITNIIDILDVAGTHIKTNLSPDEMKGLLWNYKGINKETVHTIQLESYWKSPYVRVSAENLKKVQVQLKQVFFLTDSIQ